MVRRFDSLDGLRGLLACLIAAFHFWTTSPVTTSHFMRNGFLAVDFFFVLSGFVIAANYEHRLTDWRGVREFIWLRLGRLVPLHAAVLLGLVALETFAWLEYPYLLDHRPFGPSTSIAALVSNVFLVQALHVHESLTWNGPAWSISAEFWAYVMFALACWSVGSARLRRFLWLLPLPVVALALAPNQMDSTFDYGLLRAVTGFAAGACSWRAFVLGEGSYRSTRATVLQAACLACAIVLLCHPRGNLQLLAPLVMAALVFAFAQTSGIFSRALEIPPFKWLGERSYSVYLIHAPVLVGFTIVFNALRSHTGIDLASSVVWNGVQMHAWGRTPVEGSLLLAAFLVATVCASAVTYKHIEMPARMWSRSRLEPRREVISATVEQATA